MLIAVYDGYHSLDLDNLFRNVAWTSLYYGGTSIDDPLVSSLSHFKRICGELSIQLDSVHCWNQWNQDWVSLEYSPYLLIISGSSSYLEVHQILELVEKGSNLLIISPPVLIVENISEESLSSSHNYFLECLEKHLCVSLKEIEETDYGKGKVFYIDDANQINDLLLEPGPFGVCKDLEKEVKEEKIRSLIKRITTFNVPCFDYQVRSVPACWVQDTPLVIEIELTQRSFNSVEEVIVTVEIPNSFEPLSTTEIQLKNIKSNLSRSVVVLVAPRSKGIYHNPISINIVWRGVKQHIFLPESQIEIIGNLPELLRASPPVSIDISSALPKYNSILKPVTTASNIIELLNVDPDAVVVKVRKVGEYICKSIAREKLQAYNSRWTFNDTIKKLFYASILNYKAKGYIETIRQFGNIAAHADDANTDVNHEDAVVICYALVLFIKEVTDANLI